MLDKNKNLSIEKFRSEADNTKGSSLKVQLHEIVSEEEDEEGVSNKKPVNLKVDTNKKGAAKGNFPPIKMPTLKITTKNMN